LTESLLEDGWDVVGVDCFNRNYARREKLRNLERARSWDNFDFVPIDLADGDLYEFVAESDVVFHLASEPGVRASWGTRFETYIRNNVLATQHLLDAARAHPEKRLVYASSSSIYGQAERFPTPEDVVPAPRSPYGVTKLTAEHLCEAYGRSFGIPVAALRLFTVYGPRQRPDMAFSRLVRAALSGEPFEIYGDGRQTRDFTFVGDVVQALRDAARSPWCGIANIGGGSRRSLNDAVEIIGELLGHLRILRRPEAAGDARDTAADISVAAAAFGYRPRTSLRDGLAAMVATERVSDEAL